MDYVVKQFSSCEISRPKKENFLGVELWGQLNAPIIGIDFLNKIHSLFLIPLPDKK